ERFGEDALRMMRAVRFATELDFEIEKKTSEAIQKNNNLLEEIAEERIRDELVKIMKSSRADMGIRLLEEVGLLEYIMPELREGIECYQSGHHIYTVWEHNVRSLKYAAENNYPLRTRMAALLHDVGKPRTKEGEGEEATYYNHEVVGAEMTSDILERLKFPSDFVDTVSHLVRYHLFYYEIGEVTEAGIRRFLRRVGPENVEDLIDLRKADRIGSGVPKAVPYRLRHFLFMIDKVKRDPISVDMLEVDGNDVMEYGGIEPGPEVGYILKILLDEIIEDPEKNNEAFLKDKVKDLAELDKKELKRRAKEAQKKVESIKEKEIENLKEKHHVK
ncbi:MAG: HD domain-containing protein, partial [Candidatus Magasanikbacteria bacterium]